MSSNPSPSQPEFDSAAADYREQLHRGLKFTGESMEYFALHRVGWVKRCLDSLGETVRAGLDFGCGTGTGTPVLAQVFGNPKLLGTDPSGESLEIARKNHGALAQFSEKVTDDFLGACDLAYCNGVFHHILPAERPAAVAQVASALRPGGYFALWENNPWNPAVRFIMSRVPFDRDAILLRPGETKRLLRDAGFEIVRTDFLFIFPSALKFLRPTEKCLTKLPLGGQYCVLGRLRG